MNYQEQISAMLKEASEGEFCDMAIIGILPDGKGLWCRWTGTKVTNLVMMAEAAKHEAVTLYCDALNGKGPAA